MELKNVKGVGPQSLINLNKIGITNIDNLVSYYPYRYNIIKPIDFNKSMVNEEIIINATILSSPKLVYIKKNLSRINFMISSNGIIMNAIIFNRSFIKNALLIDTEITIKGKYDNQYNQFIISDIRTKPIYKEVIEPVYHVVHGLKQKTLNNIIISGIRTNPEMIEYIPEKINNKYHLLPKKDAVRTIHEPNDIQKLKKARIKLIYEELFIYATKVNYLRKHNQIDNNLNRNLNNIDLINFLDTLPFSLTSDQLDAVNDIFEDLNSNKRMNRLLLGDVGSGKTIVAFISMYLNYLSGYQSVLMVPTEILANQHYNNIINILPKDINITLLTGKLTKKAKQVIYDEISDGTIDIVIGTHAVLNTDISFSKLGLVITDEQHRFGVNARLNLYNKGINPDVLYMSATPIPRTYAMTIYGDMETSQIKVKPGNRLDIITKVYSEKDIKDVLLLVNKELKDNHQVYIVAPSIDQGDEDNELNDVNILKDKYQKAFPNAKIGILHGKLKNDEKDHIINAFKNHKLDILISTTIIEVGIDVSNATTMIIYNGERFGLSTLHQLRGRVGRNNLQSYCFIITEKKSERLEALEKSNDGFYISEVDFKLRGEGDLFGTNQSGDMNFKLAELSRDYKIFLQALNDSKEVMENNPELVSNIINDLEITS